MRVLLDAMGVIYQAGDDVVDLLVPFIQRRNPQATTDDIEKRYFAASAGDLDADAFWAAFGIDPGEEDQYLAEHRLTGGLLEFLDWAGREGLAVDCLSNDVGRWSHKLRVRHSLQDRIGHWVISAEVGCRKPDARIYQRYLALAGVPPAQVLFADDRVKNVRAALELGFRAVLFGPGTDAAAPAGMASVADFTALRWAAGGLGRSG